MVSNIIKFFCCSCVSEKRSNDENKPLVLKISTQFIQEKLFIPIVPNFSDESLSNYYKNTNLYSIYSNKFIGCGSHETKDNIKCITWEQKFLDQNNKEQIYRCCAMDRRFISDGGAISVGAVIFFSNISEIHQGDLEKSRKRELDFMAEARIYKNFMMNDVDIDHEYNVYSNQTSENEYINNYVLQDGEIYLRDEKVEPLYYKLDAEYRNKEVKDLKQQQNKTTTYRSI